MLAHEFIDINVIQQTPLNFGMVKGGEMKNIEEKKH